MVGRISLLNLTLWFLFIASTYSQHVVPLDLSAFRESAGFRLIREGNLLTVTWLGENEVPLRLRLNLDDAEKLIAELSHGGPASPKRRVILEDAAPAYWVHIGKRRGGWDNFFDTPSSRPHEVSEHFGKLTVERCSLANAGNRLMITVSRLWLGLFHGDLVLTLFHGSNLVKQEAVVSTQEANVAYYYDAWLTRCSTRQLNRLVWLGTDGKFHRHVFASDIDLDYVPLQVHRRTLIAEGPSRSLALFPPPHQYFSPRDQTINYSNLWYRLYRINSEPTDGDLFSFGIRQTARAEQEHWVPLVNAPPSSEQRLTLFWYIGVGDASQTFERVSAFTHNDRFVPLPGRKTFTSHYHVSLTMESRRREMTAYTPEFVDVFQKMGVNVVHLMDFHTDGHPRHTGQVRLDELRDYFEETRRLSNGDFLLLPGEEANVHYEGHWSLLLPKPLFWFMSRKPSESLERDGRSSGKAYRVGNSEDMLEMIQKEGGLAW